MISKQYIHIYINSRLSYLHVIIFWDINLSNLVITIWIIIDFIDFIFIFFLWNERVLNIWSHWTKINFLKFMKNMHLLSFNIILNVIKVFVLEQILVHEYLPSSLSNLTGNTWMYTDAVHARRKAKWRYSSDILFSIRSWTCNKSTKQTNYWTIHHWLTYSVEHRIIIYCKFTFQMKTTFEYLFVYAIYVDDLYVLHTRNVLSFEIILLVLGLNLFQTSNLHQYSWLCQNY